jgi:hypothetical protein
MIRGGVAAALPAEEATGAMIRGGVAAAWPAPIVTPPPPLIQTYPLRLDPASEPAPIRPVAVRVGDGSSESTVVPVGLDADTLEMELPDAAGLVAWYKLGPAPGDAGSAVLAGHVDYGQQRGAFFRLRDVDLGDRVWVRYEDGSTREFEVAARRHYAKAELPRDEIFRRDGSATLVLITCAGHFDSASRSYDENLVVYARPLDRGGAAGA